MQSETNRTATRADNPISELPEEAAIDHYRPRRTRIIEVRDCNRWKLKVYEITFDGSEISSDAVATAMKFAHENVAWPSNVDSKFGFVILHAGKQALWVLVHLWMNDILRQFVFCAPLNDPTSISVSPMDGFNSCVWELEVTKHERDAWVKHVLSSPNKPCHDAYLNDSIEILAEASSR